MKPALPLCLVIVAALAGCATQPGHLSASGVPTGAAPTAASCKPVGLSKEVATIGGAALGGLIGGLVGGDVAKNRSVGTRNGVLLGALIGGLAGSQLGSAIKTVQLPDGSVRLDIPGSVLFASGSATVNDGFKSTLNAIGRTVREYCNLSVQVVGHTDNVGRRPDNQVLSINRARSVVTYLVGTGIPSAQLSADGQGPDQPVADNGSEAGRQQNRRVEVFVRPPAS